MVNAAENRMTVAEYLAFEETSTERHEYFDGRVYAVSCDPRFEDAKRTTLLDPSVVVEVLSEGTEGYDRGDKFRHYQSIESIAHYVLASTTARRVEVYTRGEGLWELRSYREGESVDLPSIDVRLAVDAIYRGIELDPRVAGP